MRQKARTQQRQQRCEVLMQHMHHACFIVPVGLLPEAQIPLEAVLALPFLDLDFHARQIAAELEALAVPEPDIVVGLAFQELDAFGSYGGVEVAEDFFEEVGEEKKGGALIEALGERLV